ncbi:MAG: hypothetical protein M0Z85_04870 [Gammaproteobacteria bacterium]|nr:hypothetical protein [Gammaproteobacteria bacterium]
MINASKKRRSASSPDDLRAIRAHMHTYGVIVAVWLAVVVLIPVVFYATSIGRAFDDELGGIVGMLILVLWLGTVWAGIGRVFILAVGLPGPALRYLWTGDAGPLATRCKKLDGVLIGEWDTAPPAADDADFEAPQSLARRSDNADYPFGYINPGTGLPMLENSLLDIGGHTWGSDN